VSIRAPDDIYLNLALRAYDSGDYDRCVDLLRGCSAEERNSHKEQFADAHYRVGVSRQIRAREPAACCFGEQVLCAARSC
jgi:hypothetical protein